MRSSLLATLASLVLALSGQAQLLQAELKVGDPLTTAPGHVVKSLGQVGGGHVSVSLVSTDGVADVDRLWGACCFGVSPVSIHSASQIGSYQQLHLDEPFLIALSGRCAYSATGFDVSNPSLVLDSVWTSNDALGQHQLFAREGDPIPSMSGREWGALVRVSGYPAQSGSSIVPTWLGDIVDSSSGAITGRGLFIGAGAAPLFASGDLVPGTFGTIAVDGIDERYAVAPASGAGTRRFVQIRTNQPPGQDHYLVMDGAALNVPGGALREGEPIPAAIGGLPGEHWESFGQLGLLQGSGWFFSANTDAPAGQDEVLVKNGQILLREGESVGGEVLAGEVTWAQAQAYGGDRVVVVWGVASSAGPRAALLLDGEVLARVGDRVDLDGDGKPDPGASLSEIGSAQMGELSQVFLVAKVDVNGTPSTGDDVQALLRIQGSPRRYGIGKLNSVFSRSFLIGEGGPLLYSNDFSLEVRYLVPNMVGLALWSHGPAQIPFAEHYLYVQLPAFRILPGAYSGTAGIATVPIPIDASMVGTTRYYQYWSRDPAHPDGTGVELSNGLEVHFSP